MRCGAGVRLDIDARGLGRQGALGLHDCGDGDGVGCCGLVAFAVAAARLHHRIGNLQIALERRLELHGAGAFQCDLRLVAAVRPLHLIDIQAVLAAFIRIAALEAVHGGFRRAFPDDAIDLKRHGRDLDGQRQLLERLAGFLGFGAGRALDLQLGDMHITQFQGARQQWSQTPAELCVLHLHAHAWAFPLQRADLAATSHRARDVARLQALALGQKTRYALQRIGERVIAARPPPDGADCGDHDQQESQQQPAQAAQPAPSLLGWGRPGCRRGRGGIGRALRVQNRFHHVQNVKPRRKCKRS